LRTCGSYFALNPLDTLNPLFTLGSLRTDLALGALLTLGALRTCGSYFALNPLDTLNPLFTLGSLRTGRADFALNPLDTLNPLFTLGPLRTDRTDLALGALLALGSSRTCRADYRIRATATTTARIIRFATHTSSPFSCIGDIPRILYVKRIENGACPYATKNTAILAVLFENRTSVKSGDTSISRHVERIQRHASKTPSSF